MRLPRLIVCTALILIPPVVRVHAQSLLDGQNGGGKAYVIDTWAANASGDAVIGYNVYRTTTSGSGYTKLNAAVLPNLLYRDDSVVTGTRYYYAITAVNASGESAKSAEACVSVGGASC